MNFEKETEKAFLELKIQEAEKNRQYEKEMTKIFTSLDLCLRTYPAFTHNSYIKLGLIWLLATAIAIFTTKQCINSS